MVLDPVLVLADEPTSMLDLSLRSGILEILRRHRDTHGTGYLFITHDLALARHLCDRVAVMFRGRLVEMGRTETVVADPRHPYTKTLLQAAEELAPPAQTGQGRPASEPPRASYGGCDPAEEGYATIGPELREVAPGHYAACHPPGQHVPEEEQ
jgi:peptide/nickel transport system ATP-binding protein